MHFEVIPSLSKYHTEILVRWQRRFLFFSWIESRVIRIDTYQLREQLKPIQHELY